MNAHSEPLGQSLHLVEQALHRREQRWQRVLSDIPNRHSIHFCIAVNQLVTKCDDLNEIGNLRCKPSVKPCKLIQGLSDDLELPLNRRLDQIVG